MSKATKCTAILPAAARNMFRQGKYYQGPTFGVCLGYLQANMAMMDTSVADDFAEFCKQNYSACPLIYRSNAGEVTALLLAKDSDIRTDLPAYNVYKDGVFFETVENLLKYDWDDVVSFYLGCSFSFDDKLLNKGIKLKGLDKNVSMFTTNVKCNPVGLFSADMVVSMRVIKEAQLQLAVATTIDADYAHGGPIHLGRPADIGIENIQKSEFGSDVGCVLTEDEIPVFWACGVTSMVAVESAKLKQSFSHRPGGMFIADIKSDDTSKVVPNKVYPKPKVVCLDHELKRFSVISESGWKLLDDLEQETFQDLGQRCIKELLVKDDFHKACLSLSKNAKSVAIIVGFPVFTDRAPHEENDGIAGAIYIAKALMHLNIPVTFFIDDHSQLLRKMVEECATLGFMKGSVQIRCVGKEFCMENMNELLDSVSKKVKYTHLIAIERPSISHDGRYKTMTARDVTEFCNPVDYLFLQAQSNPDVVTIGIGDGGNEIGMGKVYENVVRTVPNGAEIASTISCDYLITCGVSNWGGLALSAGLFIARSCAVHERFQRNGIGFTQAINIDDLMMTSSQDEELHKFILRSGFLDGKTGKEDLTIDGLDYYKVHLNMLLRCREIALQGSIQ